MSTTTNPKVMAAAVEYIARQEKKSRPDGKSDFGAGRWRPSEAERQPCCQSIREPSRAWPLALLDHCRSAGHVASLFDVDALELRRAARELKKQESQGVAA
jgi:hypothetical protein